MHRIKPAFAQCQRPGWLANNLPLQRIPWFSGPFRPVSAPKRHLDWFSRYCMA